MRNGHYIIDAHCHIYPDKIAEKAARHISDFYDGLHYCGGSAGVLLELMDAQGIDFAVVNSAAMTPRQVEPILEFLLEITELHAGRFAPVGTVHPDNTDEELERAVRFLLEHGFHGVKLHPDMLAIPVDDPRMLRIFARLQEADIPVLLHTGDPRYDYSNPNRVEPVVRQFPRLTFIGGHFGGREFFQEAAERMRGCENFFVDSSSAFDVLEPPEAMRCIRTYGIPKVMFGTDHPMFVPNKDLDYLLKLPLTEQELDAILSENARRIFRLPPHTGGIE